MKREVSYNHSFNTELNETIHVHLVFYKKDGGFTRIDTKKSNNAGIMLMTGTNLSEHMINENELNKLAQSLKLNTITFNDVKGIRNQILGAVRNNVVRLFQQENNLNFSLTP